MKIPQNIINAMLTTSLLFTTMVNVAEAKLYSFDAAVERPAVSADPSLDWELAQREAEQLTIEQAGVYLLSSSEAINGFLQEDSIEMIVGTLAESVVQEKQVIDTEKGNKKYRVKVHTIVDTAAIEAAGQKSKKDLQEMQSKYSRLSKDYWSLRRQYDSLLDQQAQQQKTELERKLKTNTLLNKAHKAYYIGNKQDAMNYVESVIAIDPHNADAYYLRGLLWFWFNRQDYQNLALADYNKALEYNPNHENALGQRAEIYFSKHEFEAAKRSFDKALQINPLHEFNYAEREALLKVMADPEHRIWSYAFYPVNTPAEEIITEETQIINKAPQDSAYRYYRRGQAYASLDKKVEAQADYTTALKLDPKYVAAYLARAQLATVGYWLLMNDENILSDLDKAVELVPGYAGAYVARGDYNVFAAQIMSAFDENIATRLQSAAADYNKAIELDSNDPELYVKHAIVLNKQGYSHLALVELNKAIALNPEGAEKYRNTFNKQEQ